MHPYAKFEVCSFTRFGDTFEVVPNFIKVTWPRPRPFYEILFVHFGEIVHMHLLAKFQVCTLTRFGDMFQGVRNFLRVTWPRPRPLSTFSFLHFWEIVHVHRFAKFEVCSFTHVGDMFEGVPNFIRVAWPRPRPFSEILFVRFGEIVLSDTHGSWLCWRHSPGVWDHHECPGSSTETWDSCSHGRSDHQPVKDESDDYRR